MPPKKCSRLEESDSAEISATCRGCQKVLISLAWLKKHLERSKTNCIKSYSEEEYQSLGQKINEENKAKKAQNYQNNKAKRSEWYRENKAKRAHWYPENKEKNAEQYQENKEKIAQRYQEKKEEDEPLLEHEFIVSLDNIELNSNRTVQCIIKYQYKLFARKDFSTGRTFSVNPNESKKIPTLFATEFYNEFIVKPHKKKSEIKDHLKNNPLIIRVYDEEVEIGTVNVNLMKLYEEESFHGTQNSFKEKFQILKKENMGTSQNGETIGMIECFFALVTKECTTCKSCNVSFAKSSMFKHLNQIKSCKADHSANDMLDLKNISNDAQKRKRNERDKANYDPERRAKKHKAAYKPKILALKHEESYKPIKKETRRELLDKEMRKAKTDFWQKKYNRNK